MIRPSFKLGRAAKLSALAASFLVTASTTGLAQQIPANQISPKALRQITKALSIKESLSPAEAKISSNIMLASRKARFLPIGGSDRTDRTNISDDGLATVKITGKVNNQVLNLIKANGGQVLESYKADRTILAKVPLAALATIAESPKVESIDEPDIFWTNVGAVTSQGYVTHKANNVVESMGINGTGVKVGVLSDSASATEVAALQGTGDLPSGTGTTVLTAGSGEDEGCAMMEIIHDMAPGAQVSFNTGTTTATFAAAITTLSNSGCKIIVDDISFANEGVFQDDVIARAVNTHVANGGIYFSSAANSGNLDSGTGGTWEGDFLNGGAATTPVSTSEGATAVAYIHNFGTATNPVLYDTLTETTTLITLKWSDPLTGGTDDYDLFVLSPDGTTVTKRSVSRQTGTRAPYESVSATVTDPATGVADFPVGSRIVIVQYAGTTTTAVNTQTRALHLDTNRGALSLATRGNVFGHNGGANTQSVAATFWNSGKQGTVPFTGAANPVELFSSDGPRKIFYNPDGTLIGSGSPVFANAAAGTTLQKPDFTAADGVTCKTPGFSPFFGTSAAAPHAAAIAALMLSANPSLTNTQIHNILVRTAMDNMATGYDYDGGAGVLDAQAAVMAALLPQ